MGKIITKKVWEVYSGKTLIASTRTKKGATRYRSPGTTLKRAVIQQWG